MTEDVHLPVAVVKRDFRRLLDAAEHGQRTVITRHGRPVAALEPLRGQHPQLPRPMRPGGLLAAIGLFEDWETMQEDMAEIVAARQKAIDRPPPNF
jgi:prevent-host-death family protein